MKKILSLALIFGMAINMFAVPAAAAQSKTQKKQSGGIDLFALKDTNQEGALTMEEAVALAMKDNTTIQVARKNAEIYAQQVRQYWSSVYPQIVASASYTRALRGQEIITSMGSFKMSLDNAASASLEGTLVLWKGGAVRAGIKAAELASQSGYLQLEETQNQIKDVVTTLCFGIILSHALIQVQQENLNIAKDHLKEITSKYKQGLASDLDVLNQKVKVSNSEPPLIQALNSYDLGLLTLRRVLNKDPQDPLSLTWQLQDVLKIKVPGLEELYKMAEENRPELVIADLNVKAAEEQVKIAKADHYGSIAAFANLAYSGTSDHIMIPVESHNSSWGSNVGLRVSIPLFEGFRVDSLVKQRKLAYDQAILQARDTERNIRIEVKRSWLNFNEAKKRIMATKGTIEEARKNLERTNIRYRNGLASRLDLDDSALLLHDAELQYVQAVHDAFTAVSNLNYAVGKEVIQK